MSKRYRVSLLFNANKVYDRQVIQGVGEYLQAQQVDWDIYLEEDFRINIENIESWLGDGTIADFDDPDIVSLLATKQIPVVGVGGSYQKPEDYPPVPYVATDNVGLVEMAFEHLKSKGIQRFAFYGLPDNSNLRWAEEREKAFVAVTEKHGFESRVFKGGLFLPYSWQHDLNRLTDWIQTLPKPIGIIAVTDSRARHILQVCERQNVMVPDNIALIGIDNEELARFVTRTPLSSVEQGCQKMGYEAARLLDNLLAQRYSETKPSKPCRIIISPERVHERQSSDFRALQDPYVIQALHFIRHNACKGIKVEQVLDYVNISRSNLENRFKSELDHSIHKEIHDAKLNKAKELILHTTLPMSEIAAVCGYPSLQYMYTVFKKDLNITPAECRASINPSDE